ncbi:MULTISPECIES: hypothetical protein [unclassified Streptomyces]|uniref:hypothetical protein n=1 Tax=unclassified Streptomyces TaxID=2593676 RepID=UPI001660B161|nr:MULTISPECIES: hypothetical protein [unclassified Streptomyces]MBD0707202.1 hypothetical protein [Streptomyces sp. CBMA291]MBD0713690.1 hypothetical protein [Streptomyces sp. CBMA370]
MPALLTALVGALVPTGAALAATPAPPPSSAAAPAGTPATTPEPEPAAQTPSEPDTAAQDSPEPEPAATPCRVLPLAPLGDPGDAVATVRLEPHGSACLTVTVEKPGLHRVNFRYGDLEVSSGGVPVPCRSLQFAKLCELAAGTYRLDISQTGSYPSDIRVSVIPLMTGPGCTGPLGTDVGAPPTTGTTADPLAVVCHTFTAEPGSLVRADLDPKPGTSVDGQIVDSTGKPLCSLGYDCLLPLGGTGDYRVLATLRFETTDGPRPYTVRVQRLSDPVGCAPASVTPYGSAPAPNTAPGSCWTYTPATTSMYEIRTVNAEGGSYRAAVYDPQGRICTSPGDCTLTAGVAYTLVGDGALSLLDLSSSRGCSDVTLARPHRDAISVPGEIDCVNLPVPRGAHVAVLTGASAISLRLGTQVVDATGKRVCHDEEASTGACVLDGTAPYRALVERQNNETTGPYGLVVHRTDAPSDCRILPAGDFGPDPAHAETATDPDTFAECLTIPASDHAARELITIARDASGVSFDSRVFDETGRGVCALENQALADCPLTPGLSHTVLLRSHYRPASFTLTRRDITSTARGCVETPATKAGAPSVPGVPSMSGWLVCHRVTTTDARDTLHLNARSTRWEALVGHQVYTATGEPACEGFEWGCAVTGSTSYQAIVMTGRTEPGYRLDAFRIATATGPAPECARGPDVTYGFGISVGVLSEERPAVCFALSTAERDLYALSFTPQPDIRKSPTPWMYDRATRQNVCSPASGNRNSYVCRVPVETYEGWTPRPTILVFGMPATPTQATAETQAKVVCSSWCGPVDPAVDALTPGTVGAGKITMRLTGTVLHEKNVVQLSRGSYRARSTTLSVAPDLRSMEVSLDLTGAPLAALNASVTTPNGATYQLDNVTVVAPLHTTVTPAVTGTPVIGAKVTATAGTWSPSADAYAYQWRANGVAIAGATASAYTVPAALLGKQLGVAVTARRAGHPTVTAVSAAVLVKGPAPKPVKAPYVSGTARVGGKVTAAVGGWSPAPTSYAYQWRLNGAAVAGATGASYTPPATARGKKLTVTVTAHRTGHLSGTATSAAQTVGYGLAPKATRAPYVSGTVKVGRTLTVNRGAWTPAPTSYTYQWYANGRAVAGATRATFTLGKAQRGARISVRVTALRTGHTTGTAWTRSTGAVAR